MQSTNSCRSDSDNSRLFRLICNTDEQVLLTYLIDRPLPDLIIKIIGYNDEQVQHTLTASIEKAFGHVMRTIMKHTSKCNVTCIGKYLCTIQSYVHRCHVSILFCYVCFSEYYNRYLALECQSNDDGSSRSY
jgi:hypothetical protein